MKTTSGMLTAAGTIALATLCLTAGAQAAPVAPLHESATSIGVLSDVRHRGRPHRHYHAGYRTYGGPAYYGAPAQVYVTPYAYHVPHVRGFDDPGFVYQGNIPSCAVDLGYGRYESCDK